MKKVLPVLVLLIALLLCSCSTNRPETPAEDFSYKMKDGEVIITGYNGTDREIYIPSTINDRPVTTIGEYAFSKYDLTHITIPDSVTSIESFAFADCACLASVELPNSLETISVGTFYGCNALIKITLPDSVAAIERVAFRDCVGLVSIELPNSLVTISDEAFRGCTALIKITFPNFLQRICNGAFSECEALANVSLPENLQYLEEDAFASCGSLDSLRIPDNTTLTIGVRNSSFEIYTFVSPVGGSSIFPKAEGKDEYEKLHTKIIVTDGSYAHEQVAEYATGYGLTVEVE